MNNTNNLESKMVIIMEICDFQKEMMANAAAKT